MFESLFFGKTVSKGELICDGKKCLSSSWVNRTQPDMAMSTSHAARMNVSIAMIGHGVWDITIIEVLG